MKHASVAITAITASVVSAAFAVSAFAATKTITVKDDTFGPKSVSIGKGSTVKWNWKGQAPHNVTVTSGPAKFHSKTQTKGSFSRKFAKPGTYKLVCTIHAPGMKMTVKVS
jgi:plastocyanin